MAAERGFLDGAAEAVDLINRYNGLSGVEPWEAALVESAKGVVARIQALESELSGQRRRLAELGQKGHDEVRTLQSIAEHLRSAGTIG